MTDTAEPTITPGRPVRLVPTPPGFWRLILGLCITTFAPLFGFLYGSMTGTPETTAALNPMYLGLFVGFVLGGLGLAIALFGGWRLWKHTRRGQEIPQESS